MIRLKNGLFASTYGSMRLQEIRLDLYKRGETNIWGDARYQAMSTVQDAIRDKGYSNTSLRKELQEMRTACLELIAQGLFNQDSMLTYEVEEIDSLLHYIPNTTKRGVTHAE